MAEPQVAIPIGLNPLPANPNFVQACRDGNVEEVKKLLLKTIGEQDFDSILQGLQAASALKKETEKRGVIKAIVDGEEIENLRDSDHNTIFRKLIKEKPDLACLMLDECYWFNEKDELVAKFKFLEDLKHIGGKSDSKTRSDIGVQSDDLELMDRNTVNPIPVNPKCSAVQPHVLELMFEHDEDSDLLLHPVVMSLLNFKWTRYMVMFFFVNLGLYLVFLSFLTAFAIHIPNPQDSVCAGNDTTNATASTCGLSSRQYSFLILAAVITIVFSILRLLLEHCQLFNIADILSVLQKQRGYNKIIEKGKFTWFIKWKYFTSLTNYVEIPLYTLSLIFVAVIHRECLCPSRQQWQIGTVAVFLAWLDLLLFMNKWPDLGIYVSMLLRIIKNFVKVSIIALFLIFSFGFAFYMAFHEPDLPDTPFENPIVTFVTMISYTISSPDISIFRLSNDDTKTDSIPYPGLSYFIWILFGITMTVLFLNFLVGLAVDDVQALRKEANKERIKQLINLFIDVEETWNIVRLLFKSVTGYRYPQRFRNNRTPDIPTNGVASQSFYVRFGIFWGDDMRNIISYAKKQKDKIGKKKRDYDETAL